MQKEHLFKKDRREGVDTGYPLAKRTPYIRGGDPVHNWEAKAEERGILEAIARPARENRRLSPKNTEQIIQELCQGRWLSRREIADLLQRNLDGLRTRFLTSMVEHGRLRLRYPDKPNRVDQAYTSTQTEPANVQR